MNRVTLNTVSGILFLLCLVTVQAGNGCNSTSEDGCNTTGNETIAFEPPRKISSLDYLMLFKTAVSRKRLPDGSHILKMADGTLYWTRLLTISKILEMTTKNENNLSTDGNNSANGTNTVECSLGICISDNMRNVLESIGDFTVMGRYRTDFIIAVVVYVFIGIVGVLGNLLVVIGVFTSKQLRNSTGVLICSLAASDILVLSYCLPVELVNRFLSSSFLLGPVLCRTWYYIRFFSVVVSTNTMSAMAVDRFVAVCRPLQAKAYCTISRARITVAGVWIASGLACIPVIYYTSYVTAGSKVVRCKLIWPDVYSAKAFSWFIFTLIFAMPVFVMFPLYLKISLVLWKSTKSMSKLQGSKSAKSEEGDSKAGNIKSRKQVIRLLMTVLAAFIICWAPVTAYESTGYRANTLGNDYTILILRSVAFFNSFLNPLLYFSMSKTFRGFMIFALKRMFCCAKQADKELSHSGKSTRISVISKSEKCNPSESPQEFN